MQLFRESLLEKKILKVRETISKSYLGIRLSTNFNESNK